MSQLTSQAPPATTDRAALDSPAPYGRLRTWARLRQAFHEMTYTPTYSGTPTYPGDLHIRWP
jgi:hypothetical protein